MAWAEVSRAAIIHNVSELRRITSPGARLMAVVKANAYGHGAIEVSRMVLANGADFLAVALVEEGLELRRAGIGTPILVMGYVPEQLIEAALQEDLTLTLATGSHAEIVSRKASGVGLKARVHVKVDTGMGRTGFPATRGGIAALLRACRLPGLEIEGIYSHFACADEVDDTSTKRQLELFLTVVEGLRRQGLSVEFRHIANSAALLRLPASHLDLVRPGITLYGHHPSPDITGEVVRLLPAMTLKAVITQVKTVPAGSGVSYGHTYVAKRPARVATVPLGYADGYPRRMSNCGIALVRGFQVPVVGRVCMDQCMLDVTDLSGVEAGEEVVFFGEQGDSRLSAQEVAEASGTIVYEIVCQISQRVPRRYV